MITQLVGAWLVKSITDIIGSRTNSPFIILLQAAGQNKIIQFFHFNGVVGDGGTLYFLFQLQQNRQGQAVLIAHEIFLRLLKTGEWIIINSR